VAILWSIRRADILDSLVVETSLTRPTEYYPLQLSKHSLSRPLSLKKAAKTPSVNLQIKVSRLYVSFFLKIFNYLLSETVSVVSQKLNRGFTSLSITKKTIDYRKLNRVSQMSYFAKLYIESV
jgi:hypothetical protein